MLEHTVLAAKENLELEYPRDEEETGQASSVLPVKSCCERASPGVRVFNSPSQFHPSAGSGGHQVGCLTLAVVGV